jgi:type VI secretion system protein ImpG
MGALVGALGPCWQARAIAPRVRVGAMFRRHFEQEVDSLWARLRRVSERHPRLEALFTRNADPRVARLVQSAAFSFASARARLADDGQAIVRPLVAAAIPECLRPRPSSTIIELSPRGRGGQVSRATFVASRTIPFETVWPVDLSALTLTDARIDRVNADLQVLRFALVGHGGVAVGPLLPRAVRIFVHFEPRHVALDLLHAIRTATDRGIIRTFDAEGRRLAKVHVPRGGLAWVRVDTSEPPITSAPADRFESSTLLRDLSAFPESLCFFDLRHGIEPSSQVARVEVELPLACVVPAASALAAEHLRLFCTPATNQFLAEIEPIPASGAERQWTLAPARRPRAEILRVRSLYVQSTRDAGRRISLQSWEAPDSPHRFDPEDVYYRLELANSPNEPWTETRLSLVQITSADAPIPDGVIEGEVLATDGAGTARLGLGDVTLPQMGANITRVTPSARANLGTSHAWRMSAYARMPAIRLAETVHLAEFLGLHDAGEALDDAPRLRRPRLRRTEHRRSHRLTSGVLHWGDEFVVDADATSASRGETWLAGAFVSRALAERNVALRSSHLVLTREGEPFADYGVQEGRRLPFPLG